MNGYRDASVRPVAGVVPDAAAWMRLDVVEHISHVGDAVYFPEAGKWVWSAEAFRLFGFQPHAAMPASGDILGRVHGRDLRRALAWLKRWLSGQSEPGEFEFRILLPEGGERWLRIVSAEPVTAPTGEAFVVHSVQDITRHKLLETEMLRAIEHERELSRVKMDFLHMITHEYRTPLGVIQSSADILLRYHDRLPDVERVGRLEDIKRSTRKLADLVEDVLMLGRSESGKLRVNVDTLDPVALVREVADQVIEAFGFPREVSVQAEGLPETFRSDGQLLRHVLTNAISNALKYSTLDKSVEVLIRGVPAGVCFAIRDHGIGIPEADQPKLFSMFHRASNVGSISGTGLGLVILKRCVDKLGGSVSLTSQPGEGTEVFITVPAGGE